MAITIKATLDASGVKVGATRAGDAIGGLKNTAENAGDALQGMASDPIDELARLAARTGDLKSAIEEMGREGSTSLGRVEAAAESTGAALRGATSGLASGVTATSSAFSATMQFVDKIKQGLDAAVRGVNALADDGNAGALELQETFGEVHERLLQAFNDPAIQEALRGIAGVVEDVILPAIDAIPEALWTTGKAATEMYVQFQVLTRQMTEDQAAGYRQMLGFADVGMKIARDAELQNREVRKAKQREAAVAKELSDIEYDGIKRSFAARLEEVGSVDELTAAVEETTAALKREASEGKLTEESRRSGIDKIRLLEDRLAQIREGHADAEKRSIDEVARVRADAGKDAERLELDEAAMRERLALQEVDRQRKVQQDKLDLERRSIEERKRLITGKDIDGAKQVLDAQSPEQVRQAILNKRGHEAEQQARQELDPKFDDDAAGKRRLESAVAKERQRAVANAKRQFDRGQIDPAEVRGAQEALANAAVNQAQQQGNVSKETAQAVRESINELGRNAGELEQLQGEMADLRKMQQAIVVQGQRRRAQVAGGRQ